MENVFRYMNSIINRSIKYMYIIYIQAFSHKTVNAKNTLNVENKT